MARKIKGYDFIERWRNSDDAFEEFKTIKLYKGIYGEKNTKILNMVNQFGQGYRDIYIKKSAKRNPPNEVNSMFGSYMNFKEKKTGKIKGDTIAIIEKRIRLPQ
jgi:hypothetical protein